MCNFHVIQYAHYLGLITKGLIASDLIKRITKLYKQKDNVALFWISSEAFSWFRDAAHTREARKTMDMGFSNYTPVT